MVIWPYLSDFLRPDSASDERGNATPTNRVDRLNQSCLASKSSMTVQYHLPTQDGPFKVQHLQLYLNAFVSSNGHMPAMPDSTSLYDWQSQNWVKLNNLVNNAKPYTSTYNSSNANQQTTPPTPSEIEDAARFANPQTGAVLLRFEFVQQPDTPDTIPSGRARNPLISNGLC